MTDRQAKLRFEGVHKSFHTRRGEVTALSPIDLTVYQGDFIALVGPSGCGKSTLLMIAAGLEAASGGTVLADGAPMREPGPDRCVVFQRFALFPTKTVTGNVEYGLRMTGVPKAERRERVRETLGMVGLSAFADAYPHELSGGMQQRAALARSIVMRPDVLLMDEPFGALDAQTRIIMQEEIARIARDLGLTVLLVTHSVEEAVYLCNRIIVLTARPGAIKHEFTVDDDWSHHSVDEAMAQPGFGSLQRTVWNAVREEITSVQ
ncbi:ABC transporter ATP-binding protein [Prauserella sp. PE36]|uniref:ABC transporter ATP-binding protein n=1 Tax=Prauserella endophytica TaxID=1592324 RepID=A0ABY2RTZ1_9PSEU|nr:MULTISPECIES: ABC transporter ATP-binding protein [Prauserella]PXY23891.1 hypothetical protein BAY59_29305 [Prauserella coralliicola]RBM16814.1 ABC transporter ATP-binding protein [Prauserella sp. PE36]TKG60496.1 ABC transporter ATP-binding protein [Prauserella endophytica]